LARGIRGAVERQRGGQRSGRGREGEDARREGHATQIDGRERLGRDEALGVVVGGQAWGFGVLRGRAAGGLRAGADAWRESSDGSAGVGAAVAGYDSVAGAGEGGVGDCPEGFGEAHYDRWSPLGEGGVGQGGVDEERGGECQEGKSPRSEIGAAHVFCGFGEVRLGVDIGELWCRLALSWAIDSERRLMYWI